MEIPRHWRLKKQRYALNGETCPHCGYNEFPPRDVCPECNENAPKPTRIKVKKHKREWDPKNGVTKPVGVTFRKEYQIGTRLIGGSGVVQVVKQGDRNAEQSIPTSSVSTKGKKN